jgi:hypothetical protein
MGDFLEDAPARRACAIRASQGIPGAALQQANCFHATAQKSCAAASQGLEQQT